MLRLPITTACSSLSEPAVTSPRENGSVSARSSEDRKETPALVRNWRAMRNSVGTDVCTIFCSAVISVCILMRYSPMHGMEWFPA